MPNKINGLKICGVVSKQMGVLLLQTLSTFSALKGVGLSGNLLRLLKLLIIASTSSYCMSFSGVALHSVVAVVKLDVIAR